MTEVLTSTNVICFEFFDLSFHICFELSYPFTSRVIFEKSFLKCQLLVLGWIGTSNKCQKYTRNNIFICVTFISICSILVTVTLCPKHICWHLKLNRWCVCVHTDIHSYIYAHACTHTGRHPMWAPLHWRETLSPVTAHPVRSLWEYVCRCWAFRHNWITVKVRLSRADLFVFLCFGNYFEDLCFG